MSHQVNKPIDGVYDTMNPSSNDSVVSSSHQRTTLPMPNNSNLTQQYTDHHDDNDTSTRSSFRTPSTITLDPTDYTSWSMQMRAMFEYGGLWDLVNPDLAEIRSEVVTSSETASSSSTVNKRRAEAYLMLSLALRDNETRRLLVSSPTGDPRALWLSLQRRFTHMPKATTASLYSQFFALRQATNETVRAFADRIMFLRHQLSMNGRIVNDDDSITVFVTGVNSQLGHAVNAFYNLSPNPFFESVVEVARGEEARLQLTVGSRGGGATVNQSNNNSAALGLNFSRGSGNGTCHGCGEKGHYIAQCPRNSAGNNGNSQSQRREWRTASQQEIAAGTCSRPGHRGHKASECRFDRANTAAASSNSSANIAATSGSNSAANSSSNRSIVSVGVAQVSEVNSNVAMSNVSVLHASSVLSAAQVVLDSGAGRTVIPSSATLLNPKPASNLQITVANGEVLNSPLQGTAVIDGAGSLRLHVKDSLQHDKIDRALLSVSSVLANSSAVESVIFRKGGAAAFTPTGAILFTATQINGIYVLDTDPDVSNALVAKVFAANVESSSSSIPPPTTAALPVTDSQELTAQTISDSNRRISLWHQRFCHRSISGIAKLIGSNGVDDIELPSSTMSTSAISKFDESVLCRCDGCAKSKSHRQPFSNHMHPSRIAKHVLYRLVSDIGGPLIVASLTGSIYFLVLIDEWSEFLSVFFLKTKGEAAENIMNWIRRAHTRHGRYPIEFHSDGGGEFIADKLVKYFRAIGTHGTLTESHTPQHNAKAERMMRTLGEWTNAILIHSGAPKRFWAHAMHTVAYVRNISQICKPDSNTPNSPTTPYGRWYNIEIPISVSHLRVWGCDADVKIAVAPNMKIQKLLPKSRLCMFVGYDEDRNYSWKFYDPIKMNVFTSRDAIFHEQQFTVAHAEMESEKSSAESIEDEDDQHWLTRTTLDGETRLVEKISLEESKNVTFDESITTIEQGATSSIGSTTSIANSLNELDDVHIPDEQIESESEDSFEFPQATASSSSSSSSKVSANPTRRSTRDRVQTHFYGKVNGNLAQGRMCYVSLAAYSLLPTPDRMKLESESAIDFSSVPKNYEEAMRSIEWKSAVEKELESHRLNGTWKFAKLPPGAKAIGFKYVFRIKLKPDGSIERYKCRLTAQGFSQREGIDYNETYAPVLHLHTLRAFMAFVAAEDYELHQLDVETAFLNALVKEDIYIRVPDGVDAPEGFVLKLIKALYGIKQAPRAWHEEVQSTLIEVLGYTPSLYDSCMFIKISRTGRTILFPLFVDDVFPACHKDDLSEMISDKELLMSIYKIKDGGNAQLILGMRVTRDRIKRTIKLDQQVYIERLLADYGATNAKFAASPEATEQVDIHADSKIEIPVLKQTDLNEIRTAFSALVGSLQYPALCTRPDIVHAVHYLSRGLVNPTAKHRAAAWRILRYLSGTTELGITFGGSLHSRSLIGYSDANWAGRAGENEGRSTSGWLVKIGSGPISFSSKNQTMVAMSSAESEYVAAALVSQEIIWLRGLIQDLIIGVSKVATLPMDELDHNHSDCALPPTPLHCDNEAAILLAKNDKTSQRSKHINVRYHFIRQQVLDGTIKLQWIETLKQPADIFTKPLGPQAFLRLRPCVMGDQEFV